jgi:hypothetical protein
MGKTQVEPFFAWMAASGMSSLRDEIYWSDVETKPGIYALRGRALRTAEVLRRAHQTGLLPLLILGYGNPLYDRGSQPSSPEGRKAYAAYAKWLVRTLGPHAPYVEVWNEWNLGAGTRPKVSAGSPEAYVALLGETYAAIKSARPETKVLAGAMGGDGEGWPWLRAALAAGLLRHADGLSVHLYNHAGPRAGGGVPEFVKRLEELRALLAAHGRPKLPIYVTETGWPNHLGPGRISEEEAARRAVRLVLELRAMPQIAGVWFYEFMDSGSSVFESEHNFGLLRGRREEKPIACALRALVPLMRGSRALWSSSVSGVRATHLASREGRALVAIWSEGKREGGGRVALRGAHLAARPIPLDCAAPTDALVVRGPGQLELRVAPFPQLFLLDPTAKLDALRVEPE